ncbi:hypothetical protein HID58_055263 [Brassica napus]|uniref:Uncharacterized protein n=1 Tax=Brassica napus TaxID=3708 RepID=A0ABQ8AJY6_BRANA|nr:hypothetical protein HID58_055263 [Brassica napus]
MTELPPGNDNGGVPLSLPSTSAEATAAGSKRFRRPRISVEKTQESPLRDGDIGFYGNSSELSGSRFGCKNIWGLTLLALGGRCFLRSRSLVETSHDRLDRERRCISYSGSRS